MRSIAKIFLTICGVWLLSTTTVWAAKPSNILVVFSYEQDFPWDVDIRQGIESVFREQAELTYFYLETKIDFANGPQKAAEAYALYRKLQPDGVIAVDDDAQTMFVLPYLKDKVNTPVVFCGVNAEPEAYGYPAGNVTGVLERFHLEETIAFCRQFFPGIRHVALLIKDSPVAKLIQEQLAQEKDEYLAPVVATRRVETRTQALQAARELREQVDLLLIESLQGVVDQQGKPVAERSLVAEVVSAFGGPTSATNAYTVRYGALCAVIKTGQEQGIEAAHLLRQAMAGTPLAELPITRNHRGKRMLNVTSMAQMGFTPEPLMLRGVELVRTEP